MNFSTLKTCYSTAAFEGIECVGLLSNELYDSWGYWQNQAAHGSDELRQIAVDMLEDCWQRKCNQLSLVDLNLTTLPPNMSHLYWLEILDVHNNKLTSLPNDLPPNLRKLNVGHNRLKKISARMLTDLKELNAANNKLSRLPTHLPDSLEFLDVQNNQLSRLSEKPPLSLRVLFINKSLVTTLPAAWARLSTDAAGHGPAAAFFTVDEREADNHNEDVVSAIQAVSEPALSNRPRESSQPRWRLAFVAGWDALCQKISLKKC
ncbi:leucine-rich repeat domain-containing protein [Sodalis ligni]|uniref:Leucine rich repeat (LRR) protein n=1 Tax=Sodalis ligni TaxID=2697027 RepID=A0A4R1NBL2_9GAMM|nr:leucine-rich repeat domain-containing protein [Sodalis ligni]TCL04693.1 hypothetical protein EZJ58_2826 [Sodalis ligni]